MYDAWILENVSDPHGNCHHYCTKMAEAFPELSLAWGHYLDPFYGSRPHWWLEDGTGEIIDPTAAQFHAGGDYVKMDLRPTGKCPNCGDYTYDHKTCCSDTCNEEYAAYVMRGRR